MSYATVSDVASEFKEIVFDTDSIVKLAEVESFIEQEEQRINMNLHWRYVLPIIDTDALLILKNIEIQLVAHRVAKIVEIRSGGRQLSRTDSPNRRIGQDSANPIGLEWATSTLLKLKLAQFDLPGEVKIPHFEGLDSGNRENDVCSVFKKGVQQW